MGEMKYHDRLPKNYLDKEAKELTIQQAEKDIIALNTSLNALEEYQIRIKSVEEFEALSSSSIKEDMEAEIERVVRENKYMPISEKEAMRKRYDTAFQELLPTLENIEAFKNKYQPVIIRHENTGFVFDSESLDNYATEVNTTHITTFVRSMYDVYKELYKALIKANNIEKTNGWREVSKEGFEYYNNFTGEVITLSLWQVLTGEYGGSEAEELTPDVFLKSVKRFVGVKI